MNSLENKTILVTGASGFIGTHLVSRLKQIEGISLILISRREHASDDLRVTWLKGSLNELTRGYWEKHGVDGIDIVFHLGAFTPKNNREADNIDRVFNDNLLGTRTLLDGLPAKTRRIIFVSTIDVYAVVKNEEVITESSHLNPAGFYGASKLFCEKLVTLWAEQRGCDYAILRYGHIFGPGEEKYKKLIPLVIRQLMKRETPTLYGTGNAQRDFLYVDDAVEATVRAAGIVGNIDPVNIVRGKSKPIREIVDLLIEQSGIKTGINFVTGKEDGHSLHFDNKLMKTVLGEWPLTSLEKGLLNEIKSIGQRINE